LERTSKAPFVATTRRINQLGQPFQAKVPSAPGSAAGLQLSKVLKHAYTNEQVPPAAPAWADEKLLLTGGSHCKDTYRVSFGGNPTTRSSSH
jgi:hypothetical protein